MSGDARFEIVTHERDHSWYGGGDCSYQWRVVIVATGDELASFSGDWTAGPGYDRYSGVRTVELADGFIVATSEDGSVARVELPTNVAIVDEGAAIELTYADGRRERRERRACILVSTNGEPFSARPLLK